MPHTILLIQTTNDIDTRTYFDFNDLNLALDCVIKMFEDRLKLINPPGHKTISYDVNELYRFIESLGDISCLIFDSNTKKYSPHPREFIKEKIYDHLLKQASRRR